MKEITLTQGQIALVDDEDYNMLMRYKWHAAKCNNIFYAVTTYRDAGKQINLFMHRMLLNPQKGKIIDHIDHNGLNNQKHNIRICTYSDNAQNRKGKGNSKFKGVYYRRGKYEVAIRDNGKLKHIASTHDEIEAAKIYDINALAIYGENAYLNFKNQ